MRIVRRIYWCVFVALLAVAVMWSKAHQNQPPLMILFIAAVWWYTGEYFSRFIGSLMIGSLRCKNCGLEIPAVSQWKLGAFTDYRDRHVLRAKNPMDGSRIGYVNCPQCSATILL